MVDPSESINSPKDVAFSDGKVGEFNFFYVEGQKLISNQKIFVKGVVLGGKWWFPD